jgi:8-oxo-dGTP pyrophosphatase MutT (NUDIX family)
LGRSGHIADIRSAIGTRLLLMPGVCNAVHDAQHRLLLLRRPDSHIWVTPGGAMEPAETPAEAAARELHEETGLDLKPYALIGVAGGPDHFVRYPNGDHTAYVTSIFAVRWDGSEIVPDGVEADAARWVAPDVVDELPMDPLARDVVGTIFGWLATADVDPAARFR